jgi:hypothetical protein
VDRYKAQAVAHALAIQLKECNFTVEATLHGETMSGGLGLEVAGIGHLPGESDAPSERTPGPGTMSGSLVVEEDDPATLPVSPVSPNRPAAAATGLLAGMLLGSLLGLRGWLVARQAATPGPHPSYWKYTLAAAAVGTVAAGLGSFAIPNRYLSTAVLRVVPFRVAGAGTAQSEIEYTARLSQLTEEILSRGSLAELIQRPSLDLYPMERRRRPMEDIIDDMRHRDLRITPNETVGFAGSSRLIGFQIAFEYVDRDKAQAVVRELTTKFTEGIVAADRVLQRDKMTGSLALEVADPATLPESPVSPNRPATAVIGLLAGILLGSFLALRRRRDVVPQPSPIGPRPSSWKYALLTAALGAIAAGLGSLALPNRYVSTAVLRMVSTDPRSAQSAAAAGEHVQEMFRPVLSRDSLAEIIQQPALQLYAPERRRRPRSARGAATQFSIWRPPCRLPHFLRIFRCGESAVLRRRDSWQVHDYAGAVRYLRVHRCQPAGAGPRLPGSSRHRQHARTFRQPRPDGHRRRRWTHRPAVGRRHRALTPARA